MQAHSRVVQLEPRVLGFWLAASLLLVLSGLAPASQGDLLGLPLWVTSALLASLGLASIVAGGAIYLWDSS